MIQWSIYFFLLSQLQIKRSRVWKHKRIPRLRSWILEGVWLRRWGGCGLITPSLEAGGGAAVVRIIVSTSTLRRCWIPSTFHLHNPRPQPRVSVALVPANCASQSELLSHQFGQTRFPVRTRGQMQHPGPGPEVGRGQSTAGHVTEVCHSSPAPSNPPADRGHMRLWGGGGETWSRPHLSILSYYEDRTSWAQ